MKRFIMIACLSVLSGFVNADWIVDQSQSDIHFLSTKKSHITEVHSFESFSGSLTDSGVASLEIDLASVKTGIEIRDTRMKQHLFDVKAFSTANLSAVIPQNVMAQIKQGKTITQVFKGQVTLHGVIQELSAKVTIVSTGKGLHLASVAPLLIQAEQFGLVAGIEALRKMASLSAISYTVPVTFSLFLNQQ